MNEAIQSRLDNYNKDNSSEDNKNIKNIKNSQKNEKENKNEKDDENKYTVDKETLLLPYYIRGEKKEKKMKMLLKIV